MRRVNEQQGRHFKKGDVREDGYIFLAYELRKLIKKTGYYSEKWLEPKKYDNYCKKENEEAYERQRPRREERRKFLDSLKLSSGCVDCGYNSYPEALDFDHIDRSTKEFVVGNKLYSVSMERLLKEINKCVIRCSNCHRIKSRKEAANA